MPPEWHRSGIGVALEWHFRPCRWLAKTPTSRGVALEWHWSGIFGLVGVWPKHRQGQSGIGVAFQGRRVALEWHFSGIVVAFGALSVFVQNSDNATEMPLRCHSNATPMPLRSHNFTYIYIFSLTMHIGLDCFHLRCM